MHSTNRLTVEVRLRLQFGAAQGLPNGCSAACLSVYPSIYLSVFLSVYLSVVHISTNVRYPMIFAVLYSMDTCGPDEFISCPTGFCRYLVRGPHKNHNKELPVQRGISAYSPPPPLTISFLLCTRGKGYGPAQKLLPKVPNVGRLFRWFITVHFTACGKRLNGVAVNHYLSTKIAFLSCVGGGGGGHGVFISLETSG